jgi:CHASE2 domain-containing sensor protein
MARIPKRWQPKFVFVALLVCGAAVTMLLGQSRFFQLLHLKAQDAHFVVRGSRATPEIILLLIDQKSLDAIADLSILWHPYYAQAIKAAAR